MAKKVAKVKTNKESNGFLNTFSFDKFIPKQYQTAISLGIIFITLLIFFAPMLFGDKTFQAGDIMSQTSHQTFYEKGDNYLWNPYVFCGMPLFGNPGWADIIGSAIREVRLLYNIPWGNNYAGYTLYLLILAFSMFFLMRHFKAGRGISLFVALGAMYSVGVLSLLFEGHINKYTTLAVFPLVLLAIFRMQEKIKLIDIAILTIAVKMMFGQWHIQIIFYVYFALGIYFVVYFIQSFVEKNKDLTFRLLKTVVILIVISVAGFAMHWSRLGQVYEYTPYSTRGTKSITDVTTKPAEQSNEEAYQYNTNWSFSPGEVLTFVVPSYYGFGHSIYNGPLTQNKDTQVNTYFGQMPFTHTAMYMGIIVLVLALFAMFTCWKNPIVKFLTILIVSSVFISFGKNFSLIFDLMYNYVPFFNKFRSPATILNIVQLTMPILAGFGLLKLKEIKNSKNLQLTTIVRNTAFVFAGLFVLSFILSGAFADFIIERAAASQKGTNLKALFPYMGELFANDIKVTLALLTGLGLLSYGYLVNKLNDTLLVTAVAVMALLDIWRIDNRALDFVESKSLEGMFSKPDYVTAIEGFNDNTPYRVLNLKQDRSLGSINQNSNFHVRFLMEDFSGYSSLKPRAYQDYVDVAGIANPLVWNMLNVKYIVLEKPVQFPGLKPVFTSAKSTVMLNETVLPRAYFIDEIKEADGIEILNAVKAKSFLPMMLGYVDKGSNITVEKPDSTASVDIAEYNELDITINATASGNNMLFIGNTYYPNGWKVFVDGNETQAVKVNHGFTGILLSKGKHKVELKYSPDTYSAGVTLTLILNSCIVILLAFVFVTYLKGRKKIA